MQLRKETEKIVIHCTATRADQEVNADIVKKWHIQRGFRTIGYHFLINRDGEVETGRDIEEVGAHAYGHNSTSIGVALAGGLDPNGKSDANYTDIQWDILRELIEDLVEQYPGVEIVGHNELSKKDCPCFDVQKWRDENGI